MHAVGQGTELLKKLICTRLDRTVSSPIESERLRFNIVYSSSVHIGPLLGLDTVPGPRFEYSWSNLSDITQNGHLISMTLTIRRNKAIRGKHLRMALMED